jgi:hypothetical protein
MSSVLGDELSFQKKSLVENLWNLRPQLFQLMAHYSRLIEF